LLVALIWGASFVVLKNALNDFTPLYLLGIRFSLSFAIMALLFWRRIRQATKKELLSGGVIGLFLFAGYAAQTIGLLYTTAGKQSFLVGSSVVLVPFLAWAVSRSFPGWHVFVGAMLSMVGIGLLTLQGAFYVGFGDTLSLVSAVFYAAQIVAIGYFSPDTDPMVLTTVQVGTAGISFMIFALFFEPMPKAVGSNAYLAMCYLILFATVAAFLIQNVAQKFTSSSHAAIILCLESIFGCIFSVILLGDVFTGSMIIGCVLIFVAIIIVETRIGVLLDAGIKKRGAGC